MRKTAEKEEPLTELIRKKKKWEWIKKQKKSFQKLKEEFSWDQFLRIFKKDKETTMKTDASDTMIAEVLQQKEESVAFFSK